MNISDLSVLIEDYLLPSNLEWYKGYGNQSEFTVRGSSGGVSTKTMAIIVITNTVTNNFSCDFGRKGLHVTENGIWYVLEFEFSSTLEKAKQYVDDLVKELLEVQK